MKKITSGLVLAAFAAVSGCKQHVAEENSLEPKGVFSVTPDAQAKKVTLEWYGNVRHSVDFDFAEDVMSIKDKFGEVAVFRWVDDPSLSEREALTVRHMETWLCGHMNREQDEKVLLKGGKLTYDRGCAQNKPGTRTVTF